MVLPQRACTLLLHSDSLYIQSSWLPPFLLMFGPSPCPGYYSRHLATMTSADFCSITCQVTLTGAMIQSLLVLPIVRVSSPSATAGDAWTLVSRYGPCRELLQRKYSMHAKQISPDKNVNFHYTTAAFTLFPESKGFVMLC